MYMTKVKKVSELILNEATLGSGNLIVDRKAGTIRNIKLLGLVSKNGREYTPDAVRDAAYLYEGIQVNTDHISGDKSQRSVHDRLGRIVNVRFVENDGLYGDIELLMEHPMASRLCEAAERMPTTMGFSHAADGLARKLKSGVEQIYKITKVKSVDLVADPATCNSLSEATMDEIDGKEPVKDDKPVQVCEACQKVKEALDDKDSDDAGKLGKIKEAYGEVPDGYKPSNDSGYAKKSSANEGEVPPKEEPEAKKESIESVETSRLKLITELKQLCETVKIKADTQLLTDLSMLPKEAAIRQLQRIALAEVVSMPKTSIPAPTVNLTNMPAKGKNRAEWLLN